MQQYKLETLLTIQEWASNGHECICKGHRCTWCIMWTGIELRSYDYLIVFLMWKPQWKRILVATWIHNMPKSSSYACAAVTETTFTRNWHYVAPSCIYFTVSDVSICRYKYQHYPTATMGPCIHRSLMLLATHPRTHIPLSLSLSLFLSLSFSHMHTHTTMPLGGKFKKLPFF